MTVTTINIKQHQLDKLRTSVKELDPLIVIMSELKHKDNSYSVVITTINPSYLFNLGTIIGK